VNDCGRLSEDDDIAKILLSLTSVTLADFDYPD
jgi:hypothetical protein